MWAGALVTVHSLRLPLCFDPGPLAAEVASFAAGVWTPHFNHGYHDGGWSGIGLRTVDGSPGAIYPDPQVAPSGYRETAALDGRPHLRAALAAFDCPVGAARLLRLDPASGLREHSDHNLSYEQGQVRLHVPVVTNPDVEFVLDDRLVPMGDGECWYLDLSRRHRVFNHGRTARVHLVIDAVVNDWVHALFARGAPLPSAPPLATGFDGFRARVLADPALQAQLLHPQSRADFVERAVQLGVRLGFRFAAQDVEAAWRAGQRSWRDQGTR